MYLLFLGVDCYEMLGHASDYPFENIFTVAIEITVLIILIYFIDAKSK